MNPVRPSTPEKVVEYVATWIDRQPGRVRVAIDGADAARPGELADQVAARLATRDVVHVPADTYWRQAALRLEHGRQNAEAWLHGWLDERALRREVLDDFPASGRVLPGLRDPLTDRALRIPATNLSESGVVLVSGAALLGRGLSFDVTVHVHLSSAALARRTSDTDAWTLAAIHEYEKGNRPDDVADLVVRADDPAHPALVDREV